MNRLPGAPPGTPRYPSGARTVLVAAGLSLVLHLVWQFFLATSGGDLAAQDEWAQFNRAHPTLAYNFAWYGGLHPVSYSVLSPYVMAALGVRTAGVVAGVLSSVLLALILLKLPGVRAFWPSLVGTLALVANTVSGRITFSIGLAFALATVYVFVSNPRPRWARLPLIAVGALLATASSAVAGLFLGVLAAGLWLVRRRTEAYVLGIPPVVVVVAGAIAFPFKGMQPFPWYLVLPGVVAAVAVHTTAPREWRWLRRGALIYTIGLFFFWIAPTPVGSNMDRLAMIFGPVALLVILQSGRSRNPFRAIPEARALPVGAVAAFMFLGSFAWNFIQAGLDLHTNAYATVLDAESKAVVTWLQAEPDAEKWRLEIVPSASHREASEFGAFANLAKGWNRQADAELNPMFYEPDHPITADEYQRWLQRWSVKYVVLPPGTLDYAAKQEGALVRSGLPYLKQVWSGGNWAIYEVRNPSPIVAAPGQLLEFAPDHTTVRVPKAGSYLIRTTYSPVLGVVDLENRLLPAPHKGANGRYVNTYGCLERKTLPIPDLPDPLPVGSEKTDTWVVLVAPRAGDYRIAGPYSLTQRGTPCPEAKL